MGDVDYDAVKRCGQQTPYSRDADRVDIVTLVYDWFEEEFADEPEWSNV